MLNYSNPGAVRTINFGPEFSSRSQRPLRQPRPPHLRDESSRLEAPADDGLMDPLTPTSGPGADAKASNPYLPSVFTGERTGMSALMLDEFLSGKPMGFVPPDPASFFTAAKQEHARRKLAEKAAADAVKAAKPSGAKTAAKSEPQSGGGTGSSIDSPAVRRAREKLELIRLRNEQIRERLKFQEETGVGDPKTRAIDANRKRARQAASSS